MKISQKFLLILTILIGVCGFAAGWMQFRSAPLLLPRPNILILSFCSLQHSLLAAYGAKDIEVAPNLNGFFANGSVVAGQAITSMGWTSVPTITGQNLPPAYFERHGYKLRGYREDLQMIRIPEGEAKIKLLRSDDQKQTEKSHTVMSEYLKNILRGEYFSPFFMVALFKYMHFPIVDDVNPDAEWDHYLSKEQKKYVKDLRAHPEKYPDKLPLLLYLFDNPQTEHQRGLINQPELLEKWKMSSKFAKDLDLIKLIYKANFRYLDKIIESHLNLYGDRRLRENTIIIVMGDHGESHMTHDDFTHGTSIYDSILKFPFAIHFPGDTQPSEKIDFQFHMNTLDDLIQEIIAGKVSNREDFKRFAKDHYEPNILARDCNNDWRGLRYDGHFKYMRRTADGESFLFDLKKDSDELKNIAAENPEIVAKMEALYWQNLDRYSSMDPMRCLSWLGEESTDGGGDDL